MSTEENNENQRPPAAHPHERAKLVVLAGLAGVIIILLWIWTLPLNFHGRDSGAPGPGAVLNTLDTELEAPVNPLENLKQFNDL